MSIRDEARRLDPAARRAFVSNAAKTCLGVSALSALPQSEAEASQKGRDTKRLPGFGKAKNVIYIFNSGAMSQIDTFDPKPGTEEQGSVGVIGTSVPGVQVTSFFPEIAKRMNKIAVVRSLTTVTGNHQDAAYLMRTNYKPLGSIRHPSLGVWAQHFLGDPATELPRTVTIANSDRHPGAGFMPSKFSPLPVARADRGVENTKPPGYLDAKNLNRRLGLIDKFNKKFIDTYSDPAVSAYTDFYDGAVGLMSGKDLAAFDITKEKQGIRDAYGKSRLAQGCLLARRLVESGVPFVEVGNGGWDHHQDFVQRMQEKGPELDKAVATLLDDLDSRGMLKDTLVVVTTEFGRKPQIDEVRDGRGHHPGAFCSLLIGAGVNAGQVYGATDAKAHYVEEDGVTVQDFNATIAHLMGLPLHEEAISPSGRPFTVADDGEPVTKLFA